MTNFARDFDVESANKNPPMWWNDLLSLWRPSGVPAGDYGLRLAIRKGSLNFYRKGQSVAQIEVGPRKGLCAEIHPAYLFDDFSANEVLTDENTPYAKLRGKRVSWKYRDAFDYDGPDTLHRWIKKAERYPLPGKSANDEEKMRATEKKKVDEVLDLAEDAIDLELADKGLRVDIACIEKDSRGLSIAFWEAKRARNPEVRAKDPNQPEVLGQLRRYDKFLSDPKKIPLVEKAYQTAALRLVELRKYADSLGESYPLSDNIRATAKDGVMLPALSTARLLVFHDDPTDRMWETRDHPRLVSLGIPMVVQTKPSPLRFDGNS